LHFFVGLITWALLFCAFGEDWAWNGQWFKLSAVAVIAWMSGQALQSLTSLPPLLAALLTGIVARNVGFLNMNHYSHIDAFLRFNY
jgi:hypothetical protein